MHRILLLFLFLCLNIMARGQAMYEYRYWYDGDESTMHTGVSGNGAWKMDLDIGALDYSFHTVCFQAKDTAGVWSAVKTRYFVKLQGKQSVNIEYWIDGNRQKKGVVANGRIADIDVSGLEDGLHIIHAQVESTPPSQPKTSMFIKVPQTQGIDYMRCICMIDGEEYRQERVPTSGGIINWTLDATDMKTGIHKMQAYIVTPSGVATGLKEAFFYRAMTTSERGNIKCLYAVDGSDHYVQAGSLNGNLYHFNIDASQLTDGFHSLSYMLVGEDGTSSKVMSSYFVKTPLGGNGMVQYDYWLNDNEANRNIVKIAERTNPLQLMTLLPVNSQPIRSNSFKFEVGKEGKPMMYAKNDLHMRFYDVAGRIQEASRQFVDYNVSQKVDGISPLQNTQTFERLGENAVKWFSFEAERGDSVSFKSSQATSIQLFSASGDELYNASGSESVAFGGTHMKESGTFYLAVHDITGTRDNNLTLDYAHIDKYALLGTSETTLGIMPCVQIMEIDGNGFDNLKSVSLVMGESVVNVDSIACNEKSKARLYMLLNGKEKTGKYDLVLNFDDGETHDTIRRNGFVTLEPASFDDIEVSITDPRIVADPYPVTIKLTNRSNISYQAVPFFFGVDHIDQMQSVKYMNFAIGCDKELYENGLQLSFDYDSFRGNNSHTKIVPAMIPEILPGETLTFTLGVKTGSHQTFNAYAWTETPWNLKGPEASEFISEYLYDLQTNQTRQAKAPHAAGIFDGCSSDPCDYAAGLTECTCANSLALGGTLGGIQNALQNQHNRAMRDQMKQTLGVFEDADEYFPDQYLPSPYDMLWYWLQHCIPGKTGKLVSMFNGQRQMLNNPNCKDPNPHECNPYNPGDPNEMHGYMSEAGSKYMRNDIKEVGYSIEFENNPEIANSSAHKIVVSNKLDSEVFNLTSFKPTSIQIGDRVVELDGEPNFTKTIDMRPEINAIAEVNLNYDSKLGTATWTITSLDPMTMEETYNIMQGVLPVNSNGNGIGFLNYNIGIKKQMSDGDAINNKASITFDFEEAIETPVWTNIIDAVAPTSEITFAAAQDSIVTLRFETDDNRSGVWRYNLYVQEVEGGKWTKVEDEITTSEFKFHGHNGFDYGFCVMAVDSAGNVETKELSREISIATFKAGDANGDGEVDTEDTSLATNYFLGKNTYLNFAATDMNHDNTIDSQDVALIQKVFLSEKTRVLKVRKRRRNN